MGLGGILPVLRFRILTAAKTIEELGILPVQGGMVLESLRVNGLQGGNRGVGSVGMDLGRDQRVSQKVRRKSRSTARAKWAAASAYLSEFIKTIP